jgi:alpha-galactosidase
VPSPRLVVLVALLVYALASSARADEPVRQVDAGGFVLQLDERMYSRLVVRGPSGLVDLGPYRASDFVVVAGKPLTDFPTRLTVQKDVNDELGRGVRYELHGERPGLRKELQVTHHAKFPDLLIVQSHYINTGSRDLRIQRWVSQRFLSVVPGLAPAFWSYQTGSYPQRPDWVLPLRRGFAQQNFQGMNASDYGGGTPVSDVWRRDVGVAVGHLEREPRQVSLPVNWREAGGATVGIEEKVDRVLRPGERLSTLATFVTVHRGDHFRALVTYREAMVARGTKLPQAPEAAYAPIWCGWGYERGVTLAQMRGTLPKAAALGFKWAVLDDGWQTAVGDWSPSQRMFPGGAPDMKALTADMRAQGLSPMLWWAPLAAVPGSALLREHPDYLLLDPAGKPRKISWWNAHLLCPAYTPVRAYTQSLVETFVKDWGYAGLKMDGQHLNAVPPCHNPKHQHAHPEDSSRGLPAFFALVAETAKTLQPTATLELCPCGTSYAFHALASTDLPAASDPESSWQIRSKGKTIKALLGPRAPYFGDHVELSDGGADFASTIGVGGVVGTQFTLPGLGVSKRKYQLTPAKEQHMRQWLAIYGDKRLAEAEYLGGLYDIGFDRPEAHVIRKGDRFYYAFFTPPSAPNFEGEIQLRGLGPRAYVVKDYVADAPHGAIMGPVAKLRVTFTNHLLLEAVPSQQPR